MTLDVCLAFVLTVERLVADAAGEPAHASVDRAVTKQRTFRRETFATLMTDEGTVRRQRVCKVARQIGRHFTAVATSELVGAGRRWCSHVLGNLLSTQSVFRGAPTSLASLHVQSVYHEVSFNATATLRVQWC